MFQLGLNALLLVSNPKQKLDVGLVDSGTGMTVISTESQKVFNLRGNVQFLPLHNDERANHTAEHHRWAGGKLGMHI